MIDIYRDHLQQEVLKLAEPSHKFGQQFMLSLFSIWIVFVVKNLWDQLCTCHAIYFLEKRVPITLALFAFSGLNPQLSDQPVVQGLVLVLPTLTWHLKIQLLYLPRKKLAKS